MRIAVLGAGAVGGYFGGRLVQAGADVTFIVRDQRKAQLANTGLRIASKTAGDFEARVRTITSDELAGGSGGKAYHDFDIVVLSCKAYDLDAAIETIGPAVGAHSAVLPVLNGIEHVERLSTAFGAGRVLGGLARIAATLTDDGGIQHLNDWEFLVFGELDGHMSERVVAFSRAFGGTGVSATAVPDIRQKMWEKLVHLATIAGMTTLMRANSGEIARAEGGMALTLQLLESNAEIARREGYPMPEGFMPDYRAMFSKTDSTYTASMLRDIERKGPTEADHVMGYMLRLARKHDVDVMFYSIIYAHLKAYEQRRAARRL